MKNFKTTVKAMVLTLAVGIFSSGETQAQGAFGIHLANTPDETIYPLSGSNTTRRTENTGTGSLDEKQVMVYDLITGTSSISQLGWDYNGIKGNLQLNGDGPAFDPDVVLATYNEMDYALAVFINEDGYVEWESYVWDGQNTTFKLEASCELGKSLNCAYPNVDVNANGMVVITWQEDYTIDRQWAWTTQDELPLVSQAGTYSFIRSDIFAAYGYVDGSGPRDNPTEGCRCSAGTSISPVISGTNDCRGDQVSPTVTTPFNSNGKLYEYNIYPDVAISVLGESTRITFSYINGSYFIDGTDSEIHSTSHTVYQQEFWNNAASPATASFNTIEMKGKPRIASRKSYDHPDDIQIVTANGGCMNWGIHNWGIHDDVEYSSTVLVNPHLVERESKEPVVSYVGSEDDDSDYVISWTCQVDFCLDKKNGDDVLAKTFNNGTPISPSYSYVNKDLDGEQRVPSISGRLSTRGNHYMFHTVRSSYYIQYKQSNLTAGQSQLRVKNPNGENTPGEGLSSALQNIDDQVSLKGFPNPFNENISFNFSLNKGEQGKNLSIYDMRGVEVKSFDLSNYSEGTHTLEWNPEGQLATGIYIVRFLSSERVESMEISTTK